MEDGLGAPYEPRSPEQVEDRWLQLPHSYWLDGYYKTLGLRAKVMLLVALSRPKDGFPMPYGKTRRWYGVQLRLLGGGTAGSARRRAARCRVQLVKAPRSKIGRTEQLL
jgi:hypothetical protein